MAPLITLLTDFGYRDGYVGVMKGVMAAICPTAQLIDITHAVAPQDRYGARFTLLSAYPYFPAGTIHLMVVDPGVGTDRRGVAIRTQNGLLVGPDNGVFSGVLQMDPPLAAVELNNPAYWRTLQPSTTFHGRDIFAPVAAYLGQGLPLQELGPPLALDRLVQLPLPPLQQAENRVEGVIQYIDHFGNGITTIPAVTVAAKVWWVTLMGQQLPQATTYGDVPVGSPLCLSSSNGWIEVAVHQGSAQQQLGLRVGERVTVEWQPP